MRLILNTALILFLVACSGGHEKVIDADYAKRWNTWDDNREEWIKERYLKIFFMQELPSGISTMGSNDTTNLVVDRNGFPPMLGAFFNLGDTILFAPFSETQIGEEAAMEGRSYVIFTPEDRDTIRVDRFSVFVFEELGSKFVRVRDSLNKASFSHVRPNVFPINSEMIFPAKFIDSPHSLETPFNMMGGEIQDYKGYVEFEKEGEEYRLSVKGNWVEFGDQTNGVTSYGGGRYLQFEPDENGDLLLDFNFAYSPPCAFSALTVCPLPPESNRLPFEVTAGQMN